MKLTLSDALLASLIRQNYLNLRLPEMRQKLALIDKTLLEYRDPDYWGVTYTEVHELEQEHEALSAEVEAMTKELQNIVNGAADVISMFNESLRT
jgi:uncharacterized protein YfkK (UPF0435 family)